jgi:hypothetical protein
MGRRGGFSHTRHKRHKETQKGGAASLEGEDCWAAGAAVVGCGFWAAGGVVHAETQRGAASWDLR